MMLFAISMAQSTGALDSDADGVFNDVDRCPTEAETKNGWQDEDGCPDEATSLTVRAMNNGRPQPQAQVKVIGTTVLEGPGEAMFFVPPNTTWTVTAEAAGCLTGHQIVKVPTVPAEVHIELTNHAPSVVRYAVFDPNNNPLSNTTVTVLGSGLCKPKPGPIPPKAAHRLGGGEYEVLVSAEGYNWHRETFTLAPGHDKMIIAKLKPTKVKIVKGRIEILEKVYFDTAKATIKPRSFTLLDEVADTITARMLSHVEIQGHTDARGSASYNQKLSQARANSVREYLIKRGVPPEDVAARGLGEDAPIAPNSSAEGMEQNRRVEFHILNN